MTKHRPGSDPNDFVMNTADQAREAGGMSTATLVTALASFIALLFSGISLYQTVLKQANIRLFVPETVSYTRDPNGSFEVLAVPVTIVNSGARDGVVSSMRLKVRNEDGSTERVFTATYFAEAGYFSTKEDFRAGLTRPKSPFAPVTVPGRSGHSAIVLFYPKKASKKRVIPGAGKFTFELTWQSLAVDPIPYLEAMSTATKPAPLTFIAELPSVPQYFDGQMLTGKSTRLFVQP